MKIIMTIACFLMLACNTGDYYPTYTKNLEDSIRTLDLTYIAWACECANWAAESDIESAKNDENKLADQSVFIEPADSSLELPDTLGYSGDLIRFTGQFYEEKGYPKRYQKTEQHADKAKVFRYTNYQVIRSNYKDFGADRMTKTTQ